MNSIKTNIANGYSPEETYFKNNIGKTDPTNMIDLKCAQNISHNFRKSSRCYNRKRNRETYKYSKRIHLCSHDKNDVTFNYKEYMIHDLKRFHINGTSKLNIDTMFDLVYGLCLTDMPYRNLSLIDIGGEHPDPPWPSIKDFQKDRVEFRSLAAELVNLSSKLASLKKIGYYLDLATAEGTEDIFKEAKHLWCTQQLQAQDRDELHRMKASDQVVSKTMAYIYGLQNGLVIENGLVDAYDSKDFLVKLHSLEEVWNDLVVGFYN